MHLGKIYQQNLHRWGHGNTYPKWHYDKNPNTYWAHFYKAFHNPTSNGEKIIDMLHIGAASYQLWVLNNEILASFDRYDYDNPCYNTFPGKICQQDFHSWWHWYTQPKWYYEKDPRSFWWYFQTALHNSTSNGEKIVDICRYGGGDQLWAYY